MILKTFRDPKYIASFKVPGEHHCLLTGADMPDGAHIRYGFHGMGIKPGDNLIIPLAHSLHAEQHQTGEVEFWRENWWELLYLGRGIDFVELWEDAEQIDNDIMDYVKHVARDYYAEWKERK